LLSKLMLRHARVFHGGSATFSVEVAGAAPISLQWMKNGSPIPGETGNFLVLTGIPAGDDGASYTVEASNGNQIFASTARIRTAPP